MRELPPADQLNKPRDADPIVMLPVDGFYCIHCPAYDVLGSVDWIQGPDGREFGRCRLCGSKYVCADV